MKTVGLVVHPLLFTFPAIHGARATRLMRRHAAADLLALWAKYCMTTKTCSRLAHDSVATKIFHISAYQVLP